MNEKEVMEALRSAAEDARHELTTHFGLTVADGAAPNETWVLDPGATLAKLDGALRLHDNYAECLSDGEHEDEGTRSRA